MNKTFLMYHDIVLANKIDIGEYDIELHIFQDHVKHVADRNLQHEVVFTFDDGYESHYKVAEILLEKGIKGIFFVVTGNLNTPTHLTHSQVAEIHSMGHTIASHSHTHSMFSMLNNNDVEHELIISKKILEEIIQNDVEDFAFPGGKYKQHQVKLAKALGYRRVYTSDEGYANKQSIKRMHVRQSTKNEYSSIIDRALSYYLKRELRTKLIKLKNVLHAVING